MERDARKVAAAAAAVTEVLAAEKRAATEALASLERPAGEGRARPPAAPGSTWAHQGRADLMQLRGLMQWKAFRRT